MEYILAVMVAVLAIFLMRTLNQLKEAKAHGKEGWDMVQDYMTRDHTAEKKLGVDSVNRRYMETLLDRAKTALEGMTQERDKLEVSRPGLERASTGGKLDLDSHLTVREAYFRPMTAPTDGHAENKL